jgi:ABC-type antimicrobial peptide transport system permease subunit
LDKIRKKDEEYWKEFKGTPKAFIALETGRYLWKNAIGDATSIRISRGKQELEKIRERILDDVRTRAQFVVEPVAENSRQASKNSVDFSGLFLSLSIFVILSGVLLSFTIVSFLAASRRRETAVYASLGFEKQLIVKILISEVLLLAAIALIPGLLMGILFNKLMIHLLNTVWMGAVGISSLQILVSPGTLLLSAIIGFLISATTFTTVVIRNLRKNPAGLIKSPPQIRNIKNKKILLFRAFYLICIIIALISILLSVIFSWKANPVVALLIGGILMTGLLLFIYTQFTIQKIIPVQPLQGVWHQIQRNLSARRNRSLAAIALLTIGTYTILITGSNYRTEPGSGKRDTGTGGFLLWMESAIPIPWDLNSPAGITKAGLEDIQLTDSVQIYQLTQVSSGDASCLNLNQVTTPTLTGIPTRAFDSLKAFSFSRLSPALKKKSPWLSLDRSPLENIIPAFADQTVITWGLKRNIGDTLMYQAENSKMVKVVLMGGLENSIFQGRILVSDSLLRVYFPASSEPGPMLIDAPDYKESYLTEAFEQHFRDFGLSAIPAVTRLNSFNVVQNTYLQVFLVLGGIGIIIGIFGLGIILLKNIFDSRKEIALYQAIGINSRFIFKLIAFENLYLLLAGLAVGLISSAAGMIMLPGTILMHLPWSMMATMILLILITGLAWISIPTKIVMKQHLIPNLRKE